MAIMVRRDGARPAQPAPAQEPRRWDPLRAVRGLAGWDPFQEMAPFAPREAEGFLPSFEIKETKEGFVFKADVPGVKESDLEVTTTGNRLTISGKRQAERREQTETYYAYERSYGDFSRSFALPESADMNTIRADLKDGVLTLSIRRTAALQAKKISIQTAGKKS